MAGIINHQLSLFRDRDRKRYFSSPIRHDHVNAYAEMVGPQPITGCRRMYNALSKENGSSTLKNDEIAICDLLQ